jgi:DinB superfamily
MIIDIIKKIETDLVYTFNEINNWFELGEKKLHFLPQKGGWNIEQILEHISITNHFLLILIRKATTKALDISLSQDFADELLDYDLDWQKLKAIGEHNSFEWNRPNHMEPLGKMKLNEVKVNLRLQLNECIEYLKKLEGGEGILYKTTMSVNELGKIDVYHYIYFLVLHSQRHISQMQKILLEYDLKKE